VPQQATPPGEGGAPAGARGGEAERGGGSVMTDLRRERAQAAVSAGEGNLQRLIIFTVGARIDLSQTLVLVRGYDCLVSLKFALTSLKCFIGRCFSQGNQITCSFHLECSRLSQLIFVCSLRALELVDLPWQVFQGGF
jgi:hypothetical protein